MHKFLKSIGFSDFKKKDLEIILNEIIARPQMVKVTKDSEGNEFAELSKEFATNVGITVRGNYLENDKFEMEYYYPYFYGTSLTTQEEITVEKHSEKESYAGVCEDSNIGVTLIFYLQNIADYLSEKNRRPSGQKMYGAYLSGLSVDGSILLPIEKRRRISVDIRREVSWLLRQEKAMKRQLKISHLKIWICIPFFHAE